MQDYQSPKILQGYKFLGNRQETRNWGGFLADMSQNPQHLTEGAIVRDEKRRNPHRPAPSYHFEEVMGGDDDEKDYRLRFEF